MQELVKNKRLISIKPHERMGDILHISWMLHNQCNFRCSYCREFNWKGDFRWLKLSHVTNFLDKVFYHYKKDTYHITFTGGEPTLWPEFEELCKLLRSRNCQIGLTSNGSRRIDFWKRLEKDFNWACLSYHPESTKDPHFLEVVQTLVNTCHLSVRVMMHKEKKYWDRSIAFAEKLKTLPGCSSLFVEYVPLQDDFGWDSKPTEYEDWQKAFFLGECHFEVQTAPEMNDSSHWPPVWDYHCYYDDNSIEICRPNDLVARNKVNFQNWNCNIGLDLLFVDHKGFIHRGACKQGGIVGHLLNQNPKFPTQPVQCRVNFCPCGTDIMVKKYEIETAMTS